MSICVQRDLFQYFFLTCFGYIKRKSLLPNVPNDCQFFFFGYIDVFHQMFEDILGIET